MRKAAIVGALLAFAILRPSLAQEQGPEAGSQTASPSQQSFSPFEQPANVEGREGGPRWQYQSEQTNPRTYTQPAYGPSIAIEVEQLRNRVASLEDRAEKLEVMLGKAITTINMQTDAILSLNGGQKIQVNTAP